MKGFFIMIKKGLLVSALLLLLAGCGTTSTNQEQDYEELKTSYGELQLQIEALTAEIESLKTANNGTEKPANTTRTVQFLRTSVDENGIDGYKVTEETIKASTTENAIEQVLNLTFDGVVVVKVEIQNNAQATIHFDDATLQGSHLTSSAQLAYFMDELHYAMAKNFAEISQYSLVSNGAPAVISEYGSQDEPILNTEAGLEPTYVSIFPN